MSYLKRPIRDTTQLYEILRLGSYKLLFAVVKSYI